MCRFVCLPVHACMSAISFHPFGITFPFIEKEQKRFGTCLVSLSVLCQHSYLASLVWLATITISLKGKFCIL